MYVKRLSIQSVLADEVCTPLKCLWNANESHVGASGGKHVGRWIPAVP